MCDFCCGIHQIDLHTHKDESNGIGEYVYIDESKLMIEVYQDIGGYSNVIQIKIEHCPMCGEKLD